MFERIDPNYLCTNCMNVCSDMELDCPVCGKYPLTDNHPHQLPVRTILAGKYLIGRVLGQGGFGITYLGWDLNMQCRVAIKEYYPQGCANRDPATRTEVVVADGEMRQAFNNGCDRFLQEAQVLVRLESIPEIVHVREFLKENGTAYMVMEYVEGETLKQLAARRGYKLPVEEALALMKPMLSALSEVHAAGLIHRDISPDNIMVTPTGRVKLLDFGAVRVLALHGSMSTIINVKHGYAPTEQYRIQGEQGPWTDVYAICATLYKLITGVTPPMSLDRLEEDTLQSFSALGIAMEPHVEAAILKGMALRKAERYQSVGELYAALYPHTAKVMPPTPEQPNLEATVAFVPPKEEPAPEKTPEKDVRKQAQEAARKVKEEEKRAKAEAEEKRRAAAIAEEEARLAKLATEPPKAKKKKGKKRKIWPLIAAVVVVAVVCVWLLDSHIIPNNKYNKALALMEDGEYAEAIAVFEILDGYRDSNAKIEKCNIVLQYKNAEIGDFIKFGTYEQDDNTANGNEYIEWQVLEKEDTRLLMISKNTLDCQPYNTDWKSITWETCTLRKWLNNDFVDVAFDDTEKTLLSTVVVAADKNPEYSTQPGNETTDKVFLFSIEEANTYFDSADARKSRPTNYAVASGAYKNKINGNCWWWLRSPGSNRNSAALVDCGGNIYEFGDDVNRSDVAVRPAMWIDLGA